MPDSQTDIKPHQPYAQKNVKGKLIYESQTTPSTQKTQCEVTVPPRHIIPVLFIPGIMGSNLKDINDKKVWHPGFWKLIPYSIRSASGRQKALNPATTFVDYQGGVTLSRKIPHLTEEKALARGWGSIIRHGYEDVLIRAKRKAA